MNHAEETRGGTSASGAPADALCPGRHLAQVGLPDEPSEDASFGNEIHDALRTGNSDALKQDQMSIYDGCKEIEGKLINSVFGADAKNAKVFREQRLWCKVDTRLEHSAKPDVVYRLADKALVLEYKTLPGDLPSAASNLQLRDQVVLASGSLVVKNVAAAVVQPLVTYTPELCMYDADDIARSEREMFERIRRSNDPNSPRIAGDVQCKFCKAKKSCVEYAKYITSSLPAAPLSGTPFKDWTPENKAFFLNYRNSVKKWIEMCEDAIKKQLESNPDSVPGWILEKGDTITTVTDLNALHQRFLNEGGTTDAFLKTMKVTKKELEAQLREITKLKGKKLEEKMDSILDGITTSKQNAPSLARKKGYA